MTNGSSGKRTPIKSHGSRRSGKNRLQQKQEDESRTRIVVAACDAFHVNGYFSTTVDDILNRSGVSRTTFYRHFQSKEDVVVAVSTQFSNEMQVYVDELQNSPAWGEDDVVKWLARYVKYLRKNSAIVRILRILPDSDASMKQFFSTGAVNRFVHLFGGEKGAKARSLEDKERVVTAQMLVMQFRNFTYYAVTDQLLHEKIAILHMGRAIHRCLSAQRSDVKDNAAMG